MRITVENGKVVDIVVQYETLIEGKWNAIVRYDCAHGFFHRDVLFPNGEKDKQVIEFDNLETALSYSEKCQCEYICKKTIKLLVYNQLINKFTPTLYILILSFLRLLGVGSEIDILKRLKNDK